MCSIIVFVISSSSGARPKRDGNMHRLNQDDDDDMTTYNGNSTQQY